MFLMILMAKLRKVEQKTKEICEKSRTDISILPFSNYYCYKNLPQTTVCKCDVQQCQVLLVLLVVQHIVHVTHVLVHCLAYHL